MAGDANSVAVRQAALRLLLALSEAMPKAQPAQLVELWVDGIQKDEETSGVGRCWKSRKESF